MSQNQQKKLAIKSGNSLIFELNGKKIEFKTSHEIKENGEDKYNWYEAMVLKCKSDPWRLPRKGEIELLRDFLYYKIEKHQRIFDRDGLVIPVLNEQDEIINHIHFSGWYWTEDLCYPLDSAYAYKFHSDGVAINQDLNRCEHQVLLVKEIWKRKN